MQPPFEGPIVGTEPVLEPSRVLLTAISILAAKKEFKASAYISHVMFKIGLSAIKPYRLKRGGNFDRRIDGGDAMT